MYSPMPPSEDMQAQERAVAIAAFVDNFESLLKKFTGFVKDLPDSCRDEGEVYLAELQAMFTAFEDPEIDISQAINNAESLSSISSKIKRLGIAKDIVKLYYEQGMTAEAIGQRFKLTRQTVARFLKEYEKLAPSQRNKVQRTNVYDVENNMQALYASVLRQIARFEADGEISSRLLSEWRQVLALAEKQMKENSAAKKVERLGLLVQEVLLKYCLPEARPSIFQEFNAIGIKGMLPAETEVKVVRQPIDN